MDVLNLLPEFTLIVDALDEANQETEEWPITKRIVSLCSLRNARIIILSRFSFETKDSLKDSLALSMDETCVSADITLFVAREIERNERLKRFEADIKSKLSSKAQGMFLWAKLMLEHIKTAPNGNVLLCRLDRFPKRLSDVYENFFADVGCNLDNEELALRREIFWMVSVAARPLLVDEIAYILSLHSSNRGPEQSDMLFQPALDIARLGTPLVLVQGNYARLMHQSVKEFVIGSHTSISSISSVQSTAAECHRYLALKCLFELQQCDHGSRERIKTLLQYNTDAWKTAEEADQEGPTMTSFYSYACRHWHIHLLGSKIDQELLQRASTFLTSPQFIAWAESLIALSRCQDVGPALDVRARLEAWHNILATSDRLSLDFGNFFGPFSAMIDSENGDGSDNLVVILLMHRLATYQNFGGGEPYELRKRIAEECESVLGADHWLTLRAVVDFCVERISEDEFEDAERELEKVRKTQIRVLGRDSTDVYYSQTWQASATFRQLKFEKAIELQEEASAGLLGNLGPTHLEYLKGQLVLARAIDAAGRVNEAITIFQNIWETWCPLHGTDSPLSMTTQGDMAAAYRESQRLELAEQHFSQLLANRQRIYGSKIAFTSDAAINLAAVKRDLGDLRGALSVLETASELPSHREKESHLRACQVEHLRALLDIDAGQQDSAIGRLHCLLDQAQGKPKNRELYWIRLTLAKISRQQNKANKLVQLFDNLVVRRDNPSAPFSEDEEGFEVADTIEEALQLVYNGHLTKSAEHLESKGLSWRCVQDFYIPIGGPVAKLNL